MKKILVLNGPNLNRLGKREPNVYGNQTLQDLEQILRKDAAGLEVELQFVQSNHEGALVDSLHEAADSGAGGVILNAGAYTHTSIALRDAIAATGLAVVEVHISNVHAREDFRHKSYIAGVCKGVVAGLGFEGYRAALRYLAAL